MLAMPTNEGYLVTYYTGEIKVFHRKNGDKLYRVTKDLYFKSAAAKDEKVAELKKSGYEIEGVYECVF